MSADIDDENKTAGESDEQGDEQADFAILGSDPSAERKIFNVSCTCCFARLAGNVRSFYSSSRLHHHYSPQQIH